MRVENRRVKHFYASQQGLCFRTWPIYEGVTVHCLKIIYKYFSLSPKLDYERSKLSTYQSQICVTDSVI